MRVLRRCVMLGDDFKKDYVALRRYIERRTVAQEITQWELIREKEAEREEREFFESLTQPIRGRGKVPRSR